MSVSGPLPAQAERVEIRDIALLPVTRSDALDDPFTPGRYNRAGAEVNRRPPRAIRLPYQISLSLPRWLISLATRFVLLSGPDCADDPSAHPA